MKIPWFRGRFLLRRQLDGLFLDPPDAAFRYITGRRDYPPYSLRAFVGGPQGFDRVGTVFLNELRRLGLLSRGTRILDVGCGRIARDLGKDGPLASSGSGRRKHPGEETSRHQGLSILLGLHPMWKVALCSAEYHMAGEQLYVCEIPDRLWVEGSVVIQFELDKTCPSPADLRELGLQVAFSDCSGPLKRRLEPIVLSEA